MSSPPIFVYSDTAIWRVAQVMQEHDCGFLPVVQGEKVVGAITAKDIAFRVLSEGLSTVSTLACNAMSTPAVVVHPECDAEDAHILMRQYRVHRLVVTDESGSLLGVVTLGDLADEVSESSVVKTVQRLTESHGPILTLQFPWSKNASLA
ncbi:MAG: CBS domain-containing protein [Fimbriimonas sp.]